MPSRREQSQFERLYREHHRTILNEALRLTHNEADSWDLTQETFAKAYESLGSFSPGTNARGWLKTILTRLFIDVWRRRYRHPQVRVEDLQVPAPEAEELPMWRTFSEDDLREALARLPSHNRRLLEQHVFRRQSYATLASRLRLPVPTVGTRLFRIRGQLKTSLMSCRQAEQDPATTGGLSRVA